MPTWPVEVIIKAVEVALAAVVVLMVKRLEEPPASPAMPRTAQGVSVAIPTSTPVSTMNFPLVPIWISPLVVLNEAALPLWANRI